MYDSLVVIVHSTQSLPIISSSVGNVCHTNFITTPSCPESFCVILEIMALIHICILSCCMHFILLFGPRHCLFWKCNYEFISGSDWYLYLLLLDSFVFKTSRFYYNFVNLPLPYSRTSIYSSSVNFLSSLFVSCTRQSVSLGKKL